MFQLLQIINLGIRSLLLHKLRSALTALGIIFGVCSVIAMLSIGEGASQEALERIRQLGTNSIIVRSVKPPEDTSAGATRSRVIEYGLTHRDAHIIKETLPAVEHMIPMREIRQDVKFRDRRSDCRVIGTVPEYQSAAHLRIAQGRFLTTVDDRDRANVCVLGGAVANDLFRYMDPVGDKLRIGSDYYRVVGVLEAGASKRKGDSSQEADFGSDIYIPLSSAKARFGEIIMKVSSGSREMERIELHQINVQVKKTGQVLSTAKAVKSILEKTHSKEDYELTVPLELLRQAKETKRMFNIVLGSIAGISLLVGGIGIMNIMLATVTERTREIGIRRALGAKKRDITTQFLVETIVLSVIAGLIGIGLGVLIPQFVTRFAGMRTIVTMESLVLAFGISATTGIIFGLYPARRAASMDPIEALRHE